MSQRKQEKLLLVAIKAAQQGNDDKARELLKQVLQQEPKNELAWIWMAKAAENTKEQRSCLQKVLEINPNNRPAESALNNLVGVIKENTEIDWSAMSRASTTRMDDAHYEKERRALFPKAPGRKIDKRRVAYQVSMGVLSLYLILAVFIPAVRPNNIWRLFRPVKGNVDVLFVRVYEDPLADFEPIREEDLPGVTDEDEEEVEGGFADAPIPIFEIGLQEVVDNPLAERWLVEVTISHGNTNRSYPDGWDVVLPDGTIVKVDSSQAHTFVFISAYETPEFTTSQLIEIPNEVTSFVVRGHDADGGYGGGEVTVDLNVDSGPNYEIIRN